ncbi:MAG: hypothetical protein KBT03_09535 [Bacteroidales bacterium]|nr:hypothetical protein [Candidatus Scybalousia scybalohippi]
MCRPYVEMILKHIKSFVFVGGMIVALVVFLATLNPRITSLENRMEAVEQKVLANEKEFSMNFARLESLMLSVQTDLQLLKQKLLK